MKQVNVNGDLLQVFVIIGKVGMKMNAGVNAKNNMIKVLVIKDLLGIQVIVSVNAISFVMLVSI